MKLSALVAWIFILSSIGIILKLYKKCENTGGIFTRSGCIKKDMFK